MDEVFSNETRNMDEGESQISKDKSQNIRPLMFFDSMDKDEKFDNYFNSLPLYSSMIPKVDYWEPNEEDIIFRTTKSSLNIKYSDMFGIKDLDFDNFILSSKRCYNGQQVRTHLPLYLNYFEKFFDTDHELIMVLFDIKFMIDRVTEYKEYNFISDLIRYIFKSNLSFKAMMMVNYNYHLRLDLTEYKNDKNQSLVYKDKHAKILLWMSILMNMAIPLATHFVHVKGIQDVNEFLMKIFDIILKLSDVDIYNKLYQTCITNIYKTCKANETLWSMQEMRGKDVTTHSIDSVINIILNIMPKYVFNENIVYFNYTSIRRHNHFQVYGIAYEYDYISLSSSKRDADNVSGFDKYESFTTKQEPSLYLQNKVSSSYAMNQIERLFGPFDKKEIQFYIDTLEEEFNDDIIVPFQKTLIFNLFSKYFGDANSIYSIGIIDYVKLMIASKRLLCANNLVVLPHVLSGKFVRIQEKKTINKKELERVENSVSISYVRNKYRNKEFLDKIFYIMATIIASDIYIIDYNDKRINGKQIDCVRLSEMIMEEVLSYVLLI